MDCRERAFDAATDNYGWFLRFRYSEVFQKYAKAKPESPIEEALVIAMLAEQQGDFFEFDEGISEDSLHKRKRALSPLRAFVFCQEPIGKYRVDFLVKVTLDGNDVGSIIVECDGHNFHERTKEQARRDRSRDREFTLAGYVVLRFTGSEIFQRPMSCSGEIVRACNRLAGKDY